MQHTFFVHFFAAVLHDYNVTLPETSQLHISCRKCRPCSRSLSFYCRSFSLFIGGPLAFLIYLPPLQNFRVVLPTTTKMSPQFFHLSRSLAVALFLVELRWPVAYFLFFSFSCSVFQICGHEINLCLILQTTWIQKQFPLSVFFFIDSLVVSALQDAAGYAISRQNNLELHLGCHQERIKGTEKASSVHTLIHR